LVRPNFNKIEAFILCHLQRVTNVHHCRLRQIFATNDPNLIGSNSAIHPEFFCYVRTPYDIERVIPTELRPRNT
jgi:hypothetical protein